MTGFLNTSTNTTAPPPAVGGGRALYARLWFDWLFSLHSQYSLTAGKKGFNPPPPGHVWVGNENRRLPPRPDPIPNRGTMLPRPPPGMLNRLKRLGAEERRHTFNVQPRPAACHAAGGGPRPCGGVARGVAGAAGVLVCPTPPLPPRTCRSPADGYGGPGPGPCRAGCLPSSSGVLPGGLHNAPASWLCLHVRPPIPSSWEQWAPWGPLDWDFSTSWKSY